MTTRLALATITTGTMASTAAAHEASRRLPVIVLYSRPVATPIVTPTAIDRLLSVRDRYVALKGRTHEVRLGWGPLTLSAAASRLHGHTLSSETPFRQPDRMSASAIVLDAELDCGPDVSLHAFSLAQRARRRLGSPIGSDRSFGNSAVAIGVEAERDGIGSIVLDYTTTRIRGQSGALSHLAEGIAGGAPGGTMARLSFGNAHAFEQQGRLTWTISDAAHRRSPADGDAWTAGHATDRRAQIAFRIAL